MNLINMANVFIKIPRLWRRDIKVDGTHIGWPITVGAFKETV